MTPPDQMTSTRFVAYAIDLSRDLESWDDAEHAFPGRARWEPLREESDSQTAVKIDCQPGFDE